MPAPILLLPPPPTRQESLETLLQQITTDKTHPTLKRLLLDSAVSTVHPVLARNRWITINDEDYLRIAPAIAVATRILTGDRAMHFWHALVVGKQVSSDGKGEKSQRMYEDPDGSLPTAEREKVKQMLNELAGLVMFDCEDLNSNTFGRTIHLPERFSSNTPGGIRSLITLRRDLMDEIDLQVRPPYALLRRWFIIAVTLLHEIAHALHAARYGSGAEREFEDDGFIEIGFALEKWLFGGQPVLGEQGELLQWYYDGWGDREAVHGRFARGWASVMLERASDIWANEGEDGKIPATARDVRALNMAGGKSVLA
ncbi:hypothetical protein Slin14017_G094040 [Septoria linicola]|nr:hypothetical protein Slin14017_G094040 [Septoria linicola]